VKLDNVIGLLHGIVLDSLSGSASVCTLNCESTFIADACLVSSGISDTNETSSEISDNDAALVSVSQKDAEVVLTDELTGFSSAGGSTELTSMVALRLALAARSSRIAL
jgi:hypothetical protein